MTKVDPPTTRTPAVDARTQEQLDDYERYRTAELNRYFALAKVASRSSAKSLVEDDPSIVRGED